MEIFPAITNISHNIFHLYQISRILKHKTLASEILLQFDFARKMFLSMKRTNHCVFDWHKKKPNHFTGQAYHVFLLSLQMYYCYISWQIMCLVSC